MKLISIIIPVFNGELYLEECLNSVVSQNYLNFEVVMVNDGSTDKTEAIMNDYCNKYHNFKYITTDNRGPFMARKLGIELAEGKYIAFLDCDDILLDNYFSALSTGIETNADVIVFDMLIEDLFNNKVRVSVPRFSGIDEYKKYILDSKSNSLVSKIFKKDVCNTNDLQDVFCITEEDLIMQCCFINNCNSISFVDEPLYLYKFRSNSTTKSNLDFSKINTKYNSKSLETLLLFDKKWNTGMNDNIIVNKLNFLYDFFAPVVKKYKWNCYSSHFLAFDFIDFKLLKNFNLSLVDKRKLFLLKPLLFKNRLKLWLNTRIYLIISKFLRK